MRVGEQSVLHVELQGYRDRGFSERVFDYHLMLVLRAWLRRAVTALTAEDLFTDT